MKSIRTTVQNTVFLTLIVIVMAQINIHIFSSTRFLISVAPVCLPAFLYLLDDAEILPVSILSGFGIFGTRVLRDYVTGAGIADVAAQYLPETMFYVVFGIALFIFDRLRSQNIRLRYFIPLVMVIDYGANSLELFARMKTTAYTMNNQLSLMLVAFIRGMLLLIILGSLNQYRVLLLNRNHAERYQRLIMLISRLNGEMLWMKKNVDQIEKTMDTSYRLYSELKDGGQDAYAERALKVAKDIHEVKKEYLLILRGLSESMEDETESDVLKMTELFVILIHSVNDEFEAQGKRPIITLSKEDELAAKEPYLFLSVFHNLIANAVEASDNRRCVITISEQNGGDHYLYTVQDNGPGVPEEFRDKVFEPRFSTKFNEETGMVNRGLGLSLVKDIVEESLHGTIRLRQGSGGAAFEIRIPKDAMEVVE